MSRACFKCPHCGAGSTVRTSYLVTGLIRESFHVCTNPVCGHTFVSLAEIVRTLSPSAMPRPDVDLPVSDSHQLRQAQERIAPADRKRSEIGDGRPDAVR